MAGNDPRLHFFIGTTAELIKVMPVMQACAHAGLPFRIIASGQNDIRGSELLKHCGKPNIDVVLHETPIRKSAPGLILWFARTLLRASWRLRTVLSGQRRDGGVMVVHGDTVSTVMGSILAKLYGLKLAHVEAGLRSFDFMHPFPEEIDRLITSRLADIHFCPNEWAVGNLKSRRGTKVNTGHNTLLDALTIARTQADTSALVSELRRERYFVFVMHRQENLYNEGLVRRLVERIRRQSRTERCVFILHHLTEVALQQYGLLDSIRAEAGFRTVRRLPYIEFMQVLDAAEYVVTDGGSNQEECYYLGKPCLVLRKVTERTEGLGENVVLSGLDLDVIESFLADPRRYSREPVRMQEAPSQIIVRALQQATA